MILVDTSVWVDHFRRRNTTLADLLEQAAVAIHPFVIGELALGRGTGGDIVARLEDLPAVSVTPHADVLMLVAQRRLAGAGIGWVDAHLLTSAVLDGVPLWTIDRRLSQTAERLNVSWNPRDLRW